MVQELTCKKCKHTWNYTGNSEYYVTCPKCHDKNFIGKTNKKIQPKE